MTQAEQQEMNAILMQNLIELMIINMGIPTVLENNIHHKKKLVKGKK